MSGYLARLAARATGGGGSAQPRVPARFEPVGHDEPTELRSERHAPVTGEPRMERADTPQSSPIAQRDVAEPHRDSGPAPVAEAGPDAGPARAEDAPEAPGRRATIAAEAGSTRDDAVHADASRSSAVEAEPPPLELAATVDRAIEPNQVTGQPFEAASAARVSPAAAAEPGHVQVVSARPVPQHGPVPGPDSSAETVVRISIGRVEVRAQVPPVAPAPKAVRKPEAAPTVDLHDYLRGRRDAR